MVLNSAALGMLRCESKLAVMAKGFERMKDDMLAAKALALQASSKPTRAVQNADPCFFPPRASPRTRRSKLNSNASNSNDGFSLAFVTTPVTNMAATIPLDTSIPAEQAAMQTIKTFSPLQVKSIQEKQAKGHVAVTEHAYGSHEQQRLDLFLPTDKGASSGKKLPLVVFLFGGGFTRGDKRMPPSQGAMYQNVGYWFVEHGYAAVTINYRLCPQHQAKFPSGGEDLALALEWLSKDQTVQSEVDLFKVFLMGTSAGAFHVATYLWCPVKQRTWSEERPQGVNVAGYICANLPCSFRNADPSRSEVLRAYLGEELTNDAVMMRAQSTDTTPALVLLSDHDLQTEVIEPMEQELLPAWEKCPESVPRPDRMTVKGHNHFSPSMVLGVGGEADAWSEGVLEWMQERL